jgi:hypothetical protein
LQTPCGSDCKVAERLRPDTGFSQGAPVTDSVVILMMRRPPGRPFMAADLLAEKARALLPEVGRAWV